MEEIRKQMRVVQVTARCADCGTGELVYKSSESSVGINWWPPRHAHECNNCGMATDLPKAYPSIEYEPVVTNVSQD